MEEMATSGQPLLTHVAGKAITILASHSILAYANGSYVENDMPYKSFAAIALPLMKTIEWGGTGFRSKIIRITS